MSDTEIADIFEKIDEIENVEKIDSILPKDLRPTKEEFLEAINDGEKRPQMLQKINTALRLVTSSGTNRGFVGGLFGSFLLFLSTSLKTVQENLIDLKRALIKRGIPEQKQ